MYDVRGEFNETETVILFTTGDPHAGVEGDWVEIRGLWLEDATARDEFREAAREFFGSWMDGKPTVYWESEEVSDD